MYKSQHPVFSYNFHNFIGLGVCRSKMQTWRSHCQAVEDKQTDKTTSNAMVTFVLISPGAVNDRGMPLSTIGRYVYIPTLSSKCLAAIKRSKSIGDTRCNKWSQCEFMLTDSNLYCCKMTISMSTYMKQKTMTHNNALEVLLWVILLCKYFNVRAWLTNRLHVQKQAQTWQYMQRVVEGEWLTVCSQNCIRQTYKIATRLILRFSGGVYANGWI